ncbi:MAG: ABC transporter permease [Fusobacteriaceae bacterium]
MIKENIKKILILSIVGVFIMPFIALFYEARSLDKWLEILMNKEIYLAVMNTLKIAGLTLILNFIIGVPASSVLNKNELWYVKYINGLLYLPLIVPGFIITLGIHFTFIKLNLSETILGVVLIHTVLTLPYFIKAVVAGYGTIDKSYYNLGKIVNASELQIYFNITLPKLFPSFIVGSSLVIIISFAQYVTTLIIGGGKVITLSIIIYPYISGGNFRISSILSIIFIVVNFSFIFLFEKFTKKIYVTAEV